MPAKIDEGEFYYRYDGAWQQGIEQVRWREQAQYVAITENPVII